MCGGGGRRGARNYFDERVERSGAAPVKSLRGVLVCARFPGLRLPKVNQVELQQGKPEQGWGKDGKRGWWGKGGRAVGRMVKSKDRAEKKKGAQRMQRRVRGEVDDAGRLRSPPTPTGRAHVVQCGPAKGILLRRG